MQTGIPTGAEAWFERQGDRPDMRLRKDTYRPLPVGLFSAGSRWRRVEVAEEKAVRKQNTPFSPRMKIWFSTHNAEGVFGDGKWRLLSAIAKTGSLKAASAEFGMSYRTAWGDLQKAQTLLGMALVEPRRGGKGRGGMRLTAAGKRLLAAYARFRAEVERGAESAFRRHILPLSRKGGRAESG